MPSYVPNQTWPSSSLRIRSRDVEAIAADKGYILDVGNWYIDEHGRKLCFASVEAYNGTERYYEFDGLDYNTFPDDLFIAQIALLP